MSFRKALFESLNQEQEVFTNKEQFDSVIYAWIDTLEPNDLVEMWNEFAKLGYHNFHLYENDDDGIAMLIKDYKLSGEEVTKAFAKTNRNYHEWNNFVTMVENVAVSTDNMEDIFGIIPLIQCIIVNKFKVSKKYGFEAKISDEIYKAWTSDLNHEIELY